MNVTTIEKSAPSSSPDYMINVTASNVIFKDMKIVQNYVSTLSIETVISINNINGIGYYFDNLEVSICEFGFGIKAAEYQITNCNFTYAPLASASNSNRYILLMNSNGINIIDNNTFSTSGGNNRSSFILITNVIVNSGFFTNKLFISNNTQDIASPNTMSTFFNMEEYAGNDFQLMFVNNTTSLEANVPILFYNPNFNIFRYIMFKNNTVANTVGKGLSAIDSSFLGSTNIYISGNTLLNPNFTPPFESATNPETNIIGYRSSTIPVNPSLPIVDCYWLPLS
ncbi:hypothetical protein ACER0A_010565 [Haloimpatiens sp. FM7315]|uniref:hypothetical protein n=1 Tax=Haloimpatiens sp. FM7315 TaxID=3298609 RepID=UPI0035A30464